MWESVLGAREVWSQPRWRAAESAYHARVDALVAPHLARAREGVKHPVEDFLFTYYSFSPGRLRRWHPGWRVALHGDDSERATWRHYQQEMIDDARANVVDLEAFVTERARALAWVHTVVSATLARRGEFGCFGLHEWAMVYHLRDAERRHALPLRLGAAGTDAVVDQAVTERGPLRCSHFDAFRFFTPDAVPLNSTALSRDGQPATEQPGCLHAGMDLYKWASQLVPAVPSSRVLEAFELARDIRVLDMEASPYDVRGLGYGAVRIETAAGRVEYARRQREFTRRSQNLRRALLHEIEPLVKLAGHGTH